MAMFKWRMETEKNSLWTVQKEYFYAAAVIATTKPFCDGSHNKAGFQSEVSGKIKKQLNPIFQTLYSTESFFFHFYHGSNRLMR